MKAFAVFICLTASLVVASSQNTPASYCSSPIHPTSPQNHSYDLSWWINKGPFTTMDRTNTYTFNFAICNSLPQPCLDNADPGGISVCSAPNSAYACQSWPNVQSPQVPYTACCASVSVQPWFTEYSSGSDLGIIATYGGGDDCGQCTPSARKIQYTIICDPESKHTPTVVAADNAQAPDPTYKVVIRHCSGCPIGSPGACSGSPDGELKFSLEWMFNTNLNNGSYTLALLPPPTGVSVTSKSNIGSDMFLSGSITPGEFSILTMMVRSNSFTGFGALTFFDKQTLLMNFNDASNKKLYPCYPQKQAVGAVSFVCPYDSYGALTVTGVVQH